MITIITGQGNKKLKFAYSLALNYSTDYMYFRSVDALQYWLTKNPTKKVLVIIEIDNTFIDVLRLNRHLNFILIMNSLPSDDLIKQTDWIYLFDEAIPFIKKYFTKNEVVSIPLTLIKTLDKKSLNIFSSVYDYWNEF
jgi:hypothetical protein